MSKAKYRYGVATRVPLSCSRLQIGEEMAGKGALTGSRIIDLEVVGESHLNANGTARQDIIAELAVGEEVGLKRTRSNRFDANAIEVVSRLGQIGYIGRGEAEPLAKFLDSGGRCVATIRFIGGGTPDKPSRGVWLRVALKRISTAEDSSMSTQRRGSSIGGFFTWILIAIVVLIAIGAIHQIAAG
jgi:hypothetical protein